MKTYLKYDWKCQKMDLFAPLIAALSAGMIAFVVNILRKQQFQ